MTSADISRPSAKNDSMLFSLFKKSKKTEKEEKE
jgi:hypothetical protein